MVSMPSITSIARFTSLAALTVVVGARLRDQPAAACAGGEVDIAEMTTFDPHVLGSDTWDGLFYDPFHEAYGGSCPDCGEKAMLADWQGYLGTDVDPVLWKKVLEEAPPATLVAILRRFDSDKAPTPAGFAPLFARPSARAKLRASVDFVKLARTLEPFASLDPGQVKGTMPADLVLQAKAGMSRDAFLAQRYAYLALRAQFYAKQFNGARMFYETSRTQLAGPSTDLAWRARYFYAGTLKRGGQLARANYELARVAANAPSVAGSASRDFQPVEQTDWLKTLAFATSTREKTELWRLAGVHGDGIVAIGEIRKLDPTSPMIALLLLRELAKAESLSERTFESPPTGATRSAQAKALATVETIAKELALTPGADRPWLMELVQGHIAARRGDLPTARVHIQRAIVEHPGDSLAASQARASLAMAMAVNWRINPAAENELAQAMAGIDKDSFQRHVTVKRNVRHLLAQAYLKANREVDAEFLEPGTLDGSDELGRSTRTSSWQKAGFLNDMLVRTGRTSTDFDRFVLDSAITKDMLERELAMRLVVDGRYDAARDVLRQYPKSSQLLHTDPFKMRNVDCHDCDHEKYDKAPWTHASVIAHIIDLEKLARGTGEGAAQASLELGNALYNLTHFGNARVFLGDTHQTTSDTASAERWYKRAFDLTKDRELKAKAAFYAAKCELGGMLVAREAHPDNLNDAGIPTPTKWFAIEKTLADTRYYKEVLRECSNLSAYVLTPPSSPAKP